MIIGKVVLILWPISGFFAVMVKMLSGETLMNACGESGGGGVAPGACASSEFESPGNKSGYKPSMTPPPATAEARNKKERRPRVWMSVF